MLRIINWGFNGWGGKYDWEISNEIPKLVASYTGIPALDLTEEFICEGGAVEHDGNGTMLVTRSSVISQQEGSIRNPGFTEADADEYFKTYLGMEKVIWLEGRAGCDDTDAHIDLYAKFVDSHTIVTLPKEDIPEFIGAGDADII